ncbi:hypothetical protein BKE38_11030 [Pseudoroseomonas deserti]|uniref:Uncharacterized protein n=1 Tax=Teichococcus deserti TaxID=1817963 RepID=A0A1V2H2K6_9PROT|nr:hypothetical protein [Pseudoroseomonas deserti]ONG54001.1 hypothetical protein BKE38_11030 [Pseudoroseomonas deserti]
MELASFPRVPLVDLRHAPDEESGSKRPQPCMPVLIEELIASSGKPYISAQLLSSPDLCSLLEDMRIVPPRTRALKGVLEVLGFRLLGRVTVEGTPRRYWSRQPALFIRPSGLPDMKAIRHWHLTGRQA